MKALVYVLLVLTACPVWAQGPAARTAGPGTPATAPIQTSPAQPAAQAGQRSSTRLQLTEEQVPTQAVFAVPFQVSFSFSHTPGYKVDIDQKTLPKDFEFEALTGTANSPGTFTYTLTAYPFALKEAQFTPITFLLQNAQGQTLASAQTSPVKIQVAKAKTFNDSNLREIRDPYTPYAWFKWVLLALFLGALFALWRYWQKRRNAARPLVDVEDKRPCDQIALSKLDALVQSGLWERREYKVFYLTLTDILREYLLRRFQIDTSADTSAEMLRRIKNKNYPELNPLLPTLRTFLGSSDLVKFARAVPPEEYRNRDVQTVRTVVDNTAERSEELAPTAKQQEGR